MLDGTGDIAITPPDGAESLIAMVRTRVKASLNAWKLYAIGADLQERIGDVGVENYPETQVAIQRQVTRALTADSFLSVGSFQVETLPDADRIHVFVYIGRNLITSVTLSQPALAPTTSGVSTGSGTAIPGLAIPGLASPGVL